MTSQSKSILVVEDESKLARVLEDYLKGAGYAAHWLCDGLKVIDWVRANRPDLILLDIMLPGRDGLELCREIRGFSRVPIIMVTARVEEIDRLLGLELGADDYICKPFSPREVMARIKAVLRRAQPESALDQDPSLELDPNSFRVRGNGREIELTMVEFRLFETLYRAAGRIFSREKLMDQIYDDNRIVSDRTIDSHVKKIRRKLAELFPESDLIQSVYGAGYRYESCSLEDDQAR